jgi:hypothetical protein
MACRFDPGSGHQLKRLSMKRSSTALLLSGLVFPGTGQMFLQRHVRGLCFLVPAAIALSMLGRDLILSAHDISGLIMAGQMAPDLASIAAEVERRGAGAGNTWAALVLIGAWAASVIDVWLLGRVPKQR